VFHVPSWKTPRGQKVHDPSLADTWPAAQCFLGPGLKLGRH
jgi:hypothetical protein